MNLNLSNHKMNQNCKIATGLQLTRKWNMSLWDVIPKDGPYHFASVVADSINLSDALLYKKNHVTSLDFK